MAEGRAKRFVKKRARKGAADSAEDAVEGSCLGDVGCCAFDSCLVTAVGLAWLGLHLRRRG